MKRVLVAISFLMVALSISYAKDVKFVDLGLPSGTKWATTNEKRTYTFYEAVSVFHRQMPTEAQFDELFNECDYKIDKKGILFTGKNGNTLYLPKGTYHCIPPLDTFFSYFDMTGMEIQDDWSGGVSRRLNWRYEAWCSIRRVIYPDSMPTPPLCDKNYIYLGLPSGTEWAAYDVENDTLFVDSMLHQTYYQKRLPLLCEWEELLRECRWIWTGRGYLVFNKDKNKEGGTLYIPVENHSKKPKSPAEYIYKHYRINPIRNTKSSDHRSYSLKTRLVRNYSHILRRLPFEYVDMGLPSGTKWGSFTERGGLMWDVAVEKYGASHIPTIENFKELLEHCSMQIEASGIIFTGSNGNQILIDKPYLWTKTEKKKNVDGVQAVMIEGDSIFFFFDGKDDFLNTHLIQ